MKLFRKILLVALILVPSSAFATIATPWNATSTDIGYIAPTAINGNIPFIRIPYLTTTNNTATSTILNALTVGGLNSYILVSSTTPNYGYLPLDNIDAGGSANAPETITVFNNSATKCAGAGIVLAGVSAGPFLGNFSLLFHSSSGYTGVGCPNEGPLPGSDSTLLYDPTGNLIYYAGGAAASQRWYINDATTSRAVLTTTGYGLSTSTPGGYLSVAGISTQTLTPLALFSTSTANATTTVFSIDANGNSVIGNNGSSLTLGGFGACNTTNALTTTATGKVVCGAITGSGGSSTFGTSSLSAVSPITYTQSASLAQFSINTNGITPSLFQQGGANTVFGNPTGATANGQYFATSSLFGNASSLITGLLTAADWTTFNGKQAAGNYITSLTSDVTASGPGAAAATIAANAVTYAKFQQVAANSLVGNNTSVTANATNIATSTLFGVVTPGFHLAFLNGSWTPTATSTNSCSTGISCPFANNTASFSIGANALSLSQLPQISGNRLWGNTSANTSNAAEVSTTSLYAAGTAGNVLTYTSAGTWVPSATTTFSAGSNVTLTTTGNNIQIAASGGSAGASPFSYLSNYGQLTAATTSPLWAELGIFASSTSNFDQINIGSTTLGTMSTSTDFGNFVIKGNASSTSMVVSNLGTGATTNVCAAGQGGLTITGCNNGTVTAVSVATANGFAGSSSGGATPALTITTSLTAGLVKANGTALVAAALTDFPTQAGNTWLGVVGSATAAPTANATTTLFSGTAGQNAYFTASGALVGTSTVFTTTASLVGIATTSPWAQFSVNPNGSAGAGPEFVVGSSTRTDFVINNNGNVGVSSTTPSADLSITDGDAGDGGIYLKTTANDTRAFVIENQQGSSTLTIGTPDVNGIFWQVSTSSTLLPTVENVANVSASFGSFDGFGRFTLGSTSPTAALTLDLASSTNSLRTVPLMIAQLLNNVRYVWMEIDEYGHTLLGGPPPVLSSCGTTPSITGNDKAGIVTAGSVSATGCTITFAYPYRTTPECIIENQTGSITNTFSYTVSANAIVVTETALTGDILDYQCNGLQ